MRKPGLRERGAPFWPLDHCLVQPKQWIFISPSTPRFRSTLPFRHSQPHFSSVVAPTFATVKASRCCCISQIPLVPAPISAFQFVAMGTITTSLPPVNQPRTILGPLTTTFTPPASCANVFYMTGSTSEYWYGRTGWRAQSCVGAFGNAMVSCESQSLPRSRHRDVSISSHPAKGSLTSQIDATQCWPPTTAGAAYPSPPFSGWGFYSPGIACPQGHTSACEATANGSAQWPVQYELEEGETAVGCCPTYVDFNGSHCFLCLSRTCISDST